MNTLTHSAAAAQSLDGFVSKTRESAPAAGAFTNASARTLTWTAASG